MKVRVDVPELWVGDFQYLEGQVVDTDEVPGIKGAVEAGLAVDAGEPMPKRTLLSNMRTKDGG
jgi:hypothetical protein